MGHSKPDDIEHVVARNLRRYRKAKKYTQESLALEVGLSWQQISNYEKGRGGITISRLSKIATVLGVPVYSFLMASEKVETTAQNILTLGTWHMFS